MSKPAIPWPPLLEVTSDPRIESIREALAEYEARRNTWDQHKNPLRELWNKIDTLLQGANRDGDFPTRFQRCLEMNRISHRNAEEVMELIGQYAALSTKEREDFAAMEEVEKPLKQAISDGQSALMAQVHAIKKRMLEVLAGQLAPFCQSESEARQIVSELFGYRCLDQMDRRLMAIKDTAQNAKTLIQVWGEFAPFFIQEETT